MGEIECKSISNISNRHYKWIRIYKSLITLIHLPSFHIEWNTFCFLSSKYNIFNKYNNKIKLF